MVDIKERNPEAVVKIEIKLPAYAMNLFNAFGNKLVS